MACRLYDCVKDGPIPIPDNMMASFRRLHDVIKAGGAVSFQGIGLGNVRAGDMPPIPELWGGTNDDRIAEYEKCGCDDCRAKIAELRKAKLNAVAMGLASVSFAPPPQVTQTTEDPAKTAKTAKTAGKDQSQMDKTPTKEVPAEIVRAGKQVVIPEGMPLGEAKKWIELKMVEEEQEVQIYEEVMAYPLDGANAFSEAIKARYGWQQLTDTVVQGMFGEQRFKPTMVGLEVGVGQTIQVPWGSMVLPNISGVLTTNAQIHSSGMPIFVIRGQVKRRDEREVKALAAATRDYVRDHSVYRGKAIRVQFTGDDGEVNPMFSPTFLDVMGVREEELIFSADIAALVKTSLFTPVEKTQQCRDHRVPLKRGVLLEGPYGVGKTLSAFVAAKKCAENGWTFIYLKKTSDLKHAVYFAQQYQPAMIFAEDIDAIVSGQRDEDMNAVLNVIDGVDTKSNEIIVVLTTNHVENISRAMLRPGRLDTVISVTPPDQRAVSELIRLYGRDLLAPGADLSLVSRRLDGKIPAVVREVVERAKLSAIGRISADERLQLNGDDLLLAAEGMLRHLELLEVEDDDDSDLSNKERAAKIIGASIERALTQVVKPLKNGHGTASTDSPVA